MKIFRRTVMILLAASLLTAWSVPAFAADNAFKEVFEDSMYGGLTGAIVGAALLVFTQKKNDHLDYIYYGAAGGVLVGAGYGILKTAKSFAEIENGKVKFALPTIQPDFQDAGARGMAMVVKAELVRGVF